MILTLQGDTHGADDGIFDNPSIQVGDYGGKTKHQEFAEKRNDFNYILFGNHDFMPFLYAKHSLFDAATIDTGNHNILCIRGAYSRDWAHRKEGVNYFKQQEQLNFKQGLALRDFIRGKKFDIVISHDCPFFVKKDLFGYKDKNLTSQILEIIQAALEPEMWFFGHHHQSEHYFGNNTYFRCLDRCETDSFEIEKFEVNKLIL